MVSGSRRVGRLKARNKIQVDARAAIATKAVAYIRVSTEEQAATGHGLETQDKAVRAFAESQGYELIDVIGDPGVSGATRPAERPGFGRILELAAAGAFTVLLVYKFDRLAREIRYAVTTVSDLAEQHEVVIRSVTDLNRDGIPSPGGAAWHPYRVGYVIDNPKYRGAVEYLFRWSGVETHVLQPGSHEAIVG